MNPEVKLPIHQFRGEFAFLSNFWWAPVHFDGLIFPTAEHAYQAAKTLDPTEREWIRTMRTPGIAKRAGRTVTLRPFWNDIRIAAMDVILHAKFFDLELRRKLIATHPRRLIEGNYWGDTFWGCVAVDGKLKGENHLGKLLMQLRKELF